MVRCSSSNLFTGQLDQLGLARDLGTPFNSASS